MDITKAKVTKDNTLVATYMDETGTVTVEGKNLVTNDLIRLKSGLLFLLSQYLPKALLLLKNILP